MKTRILYVDDDLSVLQGVCRALRCMRDVWDMAFAEGADAALGLLARTPFDIVITDILMPEKDGLELIREVRRDFPAVKIIAVSGGGRIGKSVCLALARKFGADRVLQKPFSVQELRRAVQDVQQGRSKPRSPSVGSVDGVAVSGEKQRDEEAHSVCR